LPPPRGMHRLQQDKRQRRGRLVSPTREEGSSDRLAFDCRWILLQSHTDFHDPG
jgi:hypothetical protein